MIPVDTTNAVQNQAGAPPASGQQRLVARRLSIVNVRGVDYEFSIEGSISGKRCDQLVKNHIEFLLTASGRNSFDSITSVFEENPNPTSNEGRFDLRSSDVTYLGKKGNTKTKDAQKDYLNSNKMKATTRQEVDKLWLATQRELTELSSGEPSPTQSQVPSNPTPQIPPTNNPGLNPLNPPQTNPQQGQTPTPSQENLPPTPPRNSNENPIITNYRIYARDQITKRIANPLKIDEALAHQISQMKMCKGSQGDRDYTGKHIFTIMRSLRDKYIKHINDNIHTYTQKIKFMEIADNLETAYQSDASNLIQACENCNSSSLINIFSKTSINPVKLKSLLTKRINFNTLTEEVKKDLIKIHAEYIKNDGKCLNEESFLEAFIEIHNPNTDPDMLQAAIVTDSPDTTQTHKPNDEDDISIDECALIFRDNQGYYYSLPRRTIPAPRPQIPTPPLTATAKFFINNHQTFKDLEPIEVKALVLNQLPNENPEAFRVLKCFIYEFDSAAWGISGSALGFTKPGTKQEYHNGITYQDTPNGYAEYRLNAFDPTELKAFLLANKDGIIALCR